MRKRGSLALVLSAAVFGFFFDLIDVTAGALRYPPGKFFLLSWAGKTVEGDGGCSPRVVGAELHSRYEALELLTLIGSRKIL